MSRTPHASTSRLSAFKALRNNWFSTAPVWQGIDQLQFYRDISLIAAKSGLYPASESKYHHYQWKERGNHDGKNILKFGDERTWVSDLAFLAGREVGEDCATHAVVVEEAREQNALLFYGVETQDFPLEQKDMIKSILQTLSSCALKSISRNESATAIFSLILPYHAPLIHARLESSKHPHPDRPNRPLLFELLTFIESTPIPDLGRKTCNGQLQLGEAIRRLNESYIFLESTKLSEEEEQEILGQIAKEAYNISTLMRRRTLETALKERNVDIAAFMKPIRQLDKLSRYWGACKALSRLARHYRASFTDFAFTPISNYGPMQVAGQNRHVHPEITMVTFLSTHILRSRPRVIGINKSSCFLCDLFIKQHRKYYIPNTNGKLMENWSIPDIEQVPYNSETRDKIQGVLLDMRTELDRLSSAPSKDFSAPRPMVEESEVFDSMESLVTTGSASTLAEIPSLHQAQTHSSKNSQRIQRLRQRQRPSSLKLSHRSSVTSSSQSLTPTTTLRHDSGYYSRLDNDNENENENENNNLHPWHSHATFSSLSKEPLLPKPTPKSPPQQQPQPKTTLPIPTASSSIYSLPTATPRSRSPSLFYAHPIATTSTLSLSSTLSIPAPATVSTTHPAAKFIYNSLDIAVEYSSSDDEDQTSNNKNPDFNPRTYPSPITTATSSSNRIFTVQARALDRRRESLDVRTNNNDDPDDQYGYEGELGGLLGDGVNDCRDLEPGCERTFRVCWEGRKARFLLGDVGGRGGGGEKMGRTVLVELALM
ncbi:MAG: hypothetical protein M1834_006063 [Cirrosporium novae-zelandiae]|nr:MAG: hypothetical protein M1834_006063 [Cirrosporium novae-zelandiae]